MNPYLAYRRPEPSSGWTRIDLLLALYDGAIERLDKAEAALARGDRPAALTLLAKTQLIVAGMATGVRAEVDPDGCANVLRLYEFVVRELVKATAEAVRDARKILCTLREGFQAIRAEAVEMERSGRLQSAERLQLVHATA